MGVRWDEDLGDQNWTGPQRTIVDNLKMKAEKETDPERKAHYLKRAEEIAEELKNEKAEHEAATKMAKEIEDRIRQERIRISNIEKKEARNYYTYGYEEETYKELERLREARMKALWRPSLNEEDNPDTSEEEGSSKFENNSEIESKLEEDLNKILDENLEEDSDEEFKY